MFLYLTLILVLFYIEKSYCYDNGVAAEPPRGWSSWCTNDLCGIPDFCSEHLVKQVADAFVDQNLVVNVLGAFLLGTLVGLPSAPKRQLLLGVGFCGSVTTFSSWMFSVERHLLSGEWPYALGLMGMTLGLGLGAAAFGFWLGKRLRYKSIESSRD